MVFVTVFFQGVDRPSEELFSTSISLLLSVFQLRSSSTNKSDFGPLRIDTFPSESDSGTMRKVLCVKWGVIP